MLSRKGLLTLLLLIYYSLFFIYIQDITVFFVVSVITFIALGMLYPADWIDFIKNMGAYALSVPIITMILVTIAYYLTLETTIAFMVGLALVILLAFALAFKATTLVYKYSMFLIGAMALITLVMYITGSSYIIFYPFEIETYQIGGTTSIASDTLYNVLKFTVVFWNVTVPALFAYFSVLLKGWKTGRGGALAGAGIGLTVSTFVVLMGLAGIQDKKVFVQIIRLMPFGNTFPDYLFDYLGVIGSAWVLIILIALVTFVTAGVLAMISRTVAD